MNTRRKALRLSLGFPRACMKGRRARLLAEIGAIDPCFATERETESKARALLFPIEAHVTRSRGSLLVACLQEKLHAELVHPLRVLDNEQQPPPLIVDGTSHHRYHQTLQVAVSHVRGEGGRHPARSRPHCVVVLLSQSPSTVFLERNKPGLHRVRIRAQPTSSEKPWYPHSSRTERGGIAFLTMKRLG